MKAPLDSFADRIVRNEEVQEFVLGLILEKGVGPNTIIAHAQSAKELLSERRRDPMPPHINPGWD